MRHQSGMLFETVLAYLKLLYWRPAPKPRSTSADQRSEHQQFSGLTNSEKKRTRIRTGPEPHSNAAIRRCLRGDKLDLNFDISVWKWKKFDICSETIAIAAPTAREVWLYSNGNTAVLGSWACCSGLTKLLHLERLIVHIFPSRRLQRSSNIIIKIHDEKHDDTSNPDQKNRRSKDSEISRNPADWVERLKEFKSFILNLKPSELPSVKVALLDDGARLEDLHGIQHGRSFWPGKPAYFAGPGEHGTEMARCIRTMCPRAELYIARLDDSRKQENQKFTILSCNQALRWAIDMEVDVISMSWTFKKKGSKAEQHEKEFIDLIKEAVSKNIILFGSLPDKGIGEDTLECAPVGLDDVIKIGSATLSGESIAENRNAKVDFLLPGEIRHTKTGETFRGSSFATTYTSGLAAMSLSDSSGSGQNPRDMKIIFNRLSGLKPDAISDRGAFVQPYDVFGEDFENYDGDPTRILVKIVCNILPDNALKWF
ncbi:Intracellular serine protease-like protein [Cladobotryum mycophilum]|uniref:Intracellular serine protease-like protein n=1 Tax=Cladobotryum mycophilum TaxID=491253 RepID=A0ABR0S8B7_9HYPO